MYQVSFQTHYEDIIDAGKVLVVARDQEDAANRARFFLDLPGSQTTFDIMRIKPNFFQLDRTEIFKNKAARGVKGLAPKDRFILTITAGVRALDEAQVLRKIGHAVLARCASHKAKIEKDISEFEVTCDRLGARPRSPQIDNQAIYKETRFFQGGAARPR